MSTGTLNEPQTDVTYSSHRGHGAHASRGGGHTVLVTLGQLTDVFRAHRRVKIKPISPGCHGLCKITSSQEPRPGNLDVQMF